MTTKTWSVRDLKPGDEVAVSGIRGGYLKISKVQRVTPSGRVVLENGDRFMPSGRMVGSGIWNQLWLEAPTDAIRTKIVRAKMVDRLRRKLDKWEQFPTETLKRIEAALAGTE